MILDSGLLFGPPRTTTFFSTEWFRIFNEVDTA